MLESIPRRTESGLMTRVSSRRSIFAQVAKNTPKDELVHYAADPATNRMCFLWRGAQPTRDELIDAEMAIETHVRVRRSDGQPGYETSAVFVPTRAEAERRVDATLAQLGRMFGYKGAAQMIAMLEALVPPKEEQPSLV